MGDDASDPIDHSRTTRQHAGETMKNGVNAPGLLVSALGLVSLVMGLGAFATGRAGAGTVAVCIAAVALLAGASWVFAAHRRVRKRELEWHDRNPSRPAQPPAS